MERKPFEFTVGGRDIVAKVGECACVLFRSMGEVDYFAVDVGEEGTLRVFNNPDVVRWMAGYELTERNSNLYRILTRNRDQGNKTFRELFGWNPLTTEKEQPSENELDLWVEVNTLDIYGELG